MLIVHAAAAKHLMPCTTSTASDAPYNLMFDRPDVEKMLRALPDKATRQTLLFSATFPQDIQQLAQFAMKPGFQLIDTVGEDSTHSSSQVPCLDCSVLLDDITHSSGSHTAQHSQAQVVPCPKTLDPKTEGAKAATAVMSCVHRVD